MYLNPTRKMGLQPVFHSSKEGWGVVSHFISSSSEWLCHAAQVQNVNFETNRATDQIRGLVYHDRSQGRILPHIHPSVSQEVPKVRFWGQSIPVSGSSVRPSIITPHFHEMCRCSPGVSSASGYSHYKLHRRLVDSGQKGFPRGQPLSHDQGHTAMLPCLGNVKETLVLVPGSRAGSFILSQDANDRCLSHGLGNAPEGRSSQGLWKDQHLSWHSNRLEMLAVFPALKNFLADLRDHHVLAHSDNTSVISYLNHQGCLRSRPLCKLACQILLWSQGKLLSLWAAYIPGAHNIEADIM